jgi:hypothetical protein
MTTEPRTEAHTMEPDDATKRLVVDACVALEGLLYPDMADTRVDPKAVNARLLAWVEKYAMDAPDAHKEFRAVEVWDALMGKARK